VGALAARLGSLFLLLLAALASTTFTPARADPAPLPFLAYLQGEPAPALIAYAPRWFRPDRPQAVPAEGAAAVRADLAQLRPVFDGLVTYAYYPQVSDQLAEAAVALGFRALVLGLWRPDDPAERAGIVHLVQRYAGRIALAVIVGNEGRTLGRYPEAAVFEGAAALRAAWGDQPVALATSEPAPGYSFGDPFLSFGDFLAPNIHLFDRPLDDLPAAVAQIVRTAERLAQVSGKPVLIKETGIPSQGGRGLAFSPERQGEFWRAYLAAGRRHPAKNGALVCTCVAFEAYDLAWKAEELENPAEGAWGLLDRDGRPKPAWAVWAGPR